MWLLGGWVTAAALALAVATASFTLARTKITGPFREWVKTRSGWLGSLMSCPYCLSHWLSATAVAIYQPVLVTPSRGIVLDCGVAWLAIVAASAGVVGIINASLKP